MSRPLASGQSGRGRWLWREAGRRPRRRAPPPRPLRPAAGCRRVGHARVARGASRRPARERTAARLRGSSGRRDACRSFAPMRYDRHDLRCLSRGWDCAARARRRSTSGRGDASPRCRQRRRQRLRATTPASDSDSIVRTCACWPEGRCVDGAVPIVLDAPSSCRSVANACRSATVSAAVIASCAWSRIAQLADRRMTSGVLAQRGAASALMNRLSCCGRLRLLQRDEASAWARARNSIGDPRSYEDVAAARSRS